MLRDSPDAIIFDFPDISLSTMLHILEWIYTGDLEALPIKDAPPEELTLAFEILSGNRILDFIYGWNSCKSIKSKSS